MTLDHYTIPDDYGSFVDPKGDWCLADEAEGTIAELVKWLECITDRLAESDDLSETEVTEIMLARAALAKAKP